MFLYFKRKMKTKIKKNELNKQQDKPLFYRRYFIILSTAGKKNSINSY